MVGKSGDKTLEQNLKMLKAGFAARLQEKLTDINVAADRIVEETDSDKAWQALLYLRDQAHKLAGSAGTYGFAEIGNAARNIELACKPFIANETLPSQTDHINICQLVITLLETPFQSDSNDTLDITPPNDPLNPSDDGFTVDHKVLVVENDPEQSMRLKIGLSSYGYEVLVIDNPQQIRKAIESFEPMAIILDTEFDGEHSVGTETIQRLRSVLGRRFPLVVMTADGNFNARLTAVKAGSDQFLTKPAKLAEIIQVLESNTKSDEKERERILVIDDDPDILDFVKSALESANMVVECLLSPFHTLDVIDHFRPELILLDLHMPVCNGRELAAIIRQNPQNMALPIIFLSAETDRDIQLEAMRAGADEFITKPINSGHLIAAVKSRSERFRVLRDMMRRDSLTGLYNHGTTWQLFEVELARANRANAPVSFAMIDIDHFKRVNDTYGHPIGDAVLKALAKLLTLRLRKGDIIGRLGGEEFGVILPGTSAELAIPVIEVIRLAFAEISGTIIGSDTPVTLSCGIVEYTKGDTIARMSEAADRLLYDAKTSGRNKVVVSKKTNRKAVAASAPPAPSEDAAVTIEKTRSKPRLIKEAIIIDDDPMIGAFIKPFAETAGFQATVLTDPTEFPSIYRAKTELIVLDLNMPVMDGIELLRFLGDNHSEASIIIVSGYDQEILSAAHNLARKQNLNIIDALSKPIDQKKLADALESAYQTSGSTARKKNLARPDTC